jgi:hypothetical protein
MVKQFALFQSKADKDDANARRLLST